MRVAIVLSTLVLFNGGKIEWSKLTLDEGVAEAKKSGKLVLAYFHDTCALCKQQDEAAFSDAEVVKRSEPFVRVLVDCTDKAVLRKMKQAHSIIGTPTVIIFDGAGKQLAVFDGVTAAAPFLKKFDEVLPKGGVAPTTGPALQDERIKAIVDRINKELVDSDKRLRADVEKIVKDELAKAGVAKTATPPKEPPKPPPKEEGDLNKQIELFIPQMGEEGVTGRFKKFLKTQGGKDFVKEALAQGGIETLADAIDMYFDKGKDGKYTIKDEFADQLSQLLDQVPGEAPKDPPKEPPKEPPKTDKKPAYLGVFPASLTDAERKDLGLTAPNGFRVEEVKKDSGAEQAGVKVGDVLVAIGGKKVSEDNMGDVMGAYKAGDTAEVTVIRGKEKLTLKVTFGEKK